MKTRPTVLIWFTVAVLGTRRHQILGQRSDDDRIGSGTDSGKIKRHINYVKTMRGAQNAMMSHMHHGKKIDDKMLDAIVLKKKEAQREKNLAVFLNKTASKKKRNEAGKKKWSQYDGVSLETLEIARNRTVRNQITSCAELIRMNFGEENVVPLVSEENRRLLSKGEKSTFHRVRRPVQFLHIPKNAGAAIEHVTMSAKAELAAKHPHTHASEWTLARKGFEDVHGRVHINSHVAITVPVDAGPLHSASNETCTCSYWHIPPRYLEPDSPSLAYSKTGEPSKVINAYTGSHVFCVVRDPLDRALSEFRVRSNNVPFTVQCPAPFRTLQSLCSRPLPTSTA